MSFIGGGSPANDEIVTTDGQGGFASIGESGVTSSTGGNPVDNLIDLAGQLAAQDEGWQ